MVLVDTSVWVSHLRYGNCHLEKLLNNEEVMCHPYCCIHFLQPDQQNKVKFFAL